MITLSDTIYTVFFDVFLLCPSKLSTNAHYRGLLFYRYKLLFMFDNATSHAIYAKDALQVTHIIKGLGGQQLFLQVG